MNYKQTDLSDIVDLYLGQREHSKRLSSFDYCYNFFKTSDSKALLADMEKSCLVLGFYLASWGMYRGSSFMLQKSAVSLVPVIKYIALLDREVWEIDVDNYTDENIDLTLKIYSGIKKALIGNLKHNHVTLISKIMLGVFGNITAYDSFFKNTFKQIFNTPGNKCGFSVVNKTSLNCLKKFYLDNQSEIDQYASQIKTLDFQSGQETNIHYPKIKIIDMYGFSKSFKQK